jgi:hypothetical protein
MTYRPEIATRLLKLHPDARRKLAEQPGPGWWVRVDGSAWLAEVVDEDGVSPVQRIGLGMGFYPCDPLAWLRACQLPGGTWQVSPDRAVILDIGPGYSEIEAATAEEVALAVMER